METTTYTDQEKYFAGSEILAGRLARASIFEFTECGLVYLDRDGIELARTNVFDMTITKEGDLI